MNFFAVVLLVSAMADQPAPQAQEIQSFEKRIADYVALRKSAVAGLPALKPGESSSRLNRQEQELGQRIREARKDAKQGDIFDPLITKELRRMVGQATKQPARAKEVKESLERAEPVVFQLRVNESYPVGVPLQSMPPTLLLNLPRLPKEVDYRVIGHSLVLRDTDANIVLDFIPALVP